MAQPNKYPEMRAPRSMSGLSADAVEFVPKGKQQPQPQPHLPYHHQAAGYQPQMAAMHQQPSHVHQRFAMAQGGVEPGGGGDGGGGYEYGAMAHQQQHHHLAGNSNGPMAMANGADVGKMSTLQNRLSNMQIVDGGNGGDNGKEFNHHHQHHHQQHHQQSMHHQQHRGQQQQHHGYHHHQHHQQQQQHQPYPYGVGGFPNNHQMAMGGGDHRKYNNGGGQQQHHHRSRQQHHHHQQHQHHQMHQQQHQQHQQQYGGNHYMEGGGGPGGYNNAGMGTNLQDTNLQEDLDQISYRQTEALDYLTEVIAELFDNPGMFDDVKRKLPNKLGDLRQDHYVLSNTIEMIFDQSIRESNFRYMGARLCQLLDSLENGQPNLVLRELLQLKMEYQNCELPEFMKQEQVKVRGATLFLAELYMQLRTPQQPFGKTISEYIVSAIEILLRKEGPENVKCVCQCLKLCGYELDQDCPDKVDKIMKNLEQLRATVPTTAEKIIVSVIELRKIAWGRGEEMSTPAAPPAMPVGATSMVHGPMGVEFHDSPVFYGPDGQVLTEEESSFLETNVGTNGKQQTYNGYDDDDEYGLVDPDDDPEVQQAFEDFLQSNPQNRLQQQYRPDV